MANKPVTIVHDGTLKDFTVDGADVKAISTNNPVAGVVVAHVILVPHGATGDVDLIIQDRIAVIDVVVQKRIGTGGAGDSVRLTTGANEPITEIVAVQGLQAGEKVHAGIIDSVYQVVSANGTLRVKRVNGGAGNVACTVIVTGVRW